MSANPSPMNGEEQAAPPAPEPAPLSEQVRLPVPGCHGCQADGHGDGHIDAAGHLQKRHSWNTAGRRKGVPNKATLVREETARRAFERSALKTAQTIVRALDSANEWVAAAAAKTILEATGAMNVAAPDNEWLEYATHAEAMQVARIVRRCNARMPVNDERGPNDAIDVATIDDGPVIDTHFAAARTTPRPALPATGNVQPEPEHVEDDGEEFDP